MLVGWWGLDNRYTKNGDLLNMDTVSILLKIVLNNFNYIFPVVFLYLLICFVGFSYFISFVKNKSWMLSLSGGMILGQLILIIFLGILSHFLKGKNGILIIFLAYLLSGIYLFAKNIRLIPKIENKMKLNNVVVTIISLTILGFLLFLVGTNEYGGDVIAYWGFATSFARGNYPIHSPWQPDLLSVHHKGTFMVEGVIDVLTKSNISLIHTFQSYFVIAAGIFFLWGLVRHFLKKDILSIIPALFTYISFGAFFIPLPNLLRQYITPEVERVTSRLPLFVDAKIRLGGASVLPDLIYINHRAAAQAGTFLIIGLIVLGLRIKERYKALIVSVLSIAVISSDESFLPVLGTIAVGWLILLLKRAQNNDRKVILRYFVFAGLIFTFLFFIVDSALRDSLFVSISETSRFRIVYLKNDIITRMNEMRSVVLKVNEGDGYFWYLADARVLIIVGIVLSVIEGSVLSYMLLFAILGSVAATLFLDHTLYPQNYARFLHQIYLFSGLLISYNLLSILYRKRTYLKYFASASILFFIIPSIIFSLRYLYFQAKKPDYPNLYGGRPTTSVLSWMDKNIRDERVFFVEGYLRGLLHSPYNLQAIQNFGFMVPVSPAYIKVHTPDFGVEAFDIIMTLNPTPIKKLKLDLIYIGSDQVKYYPEERINQLSNKNYFDVLYEDEEGKLYKIKDKYREEISDVPRGLSDIASVLPRESSVYVDYPPNIVAALRAAVLLLLKDYPHVYTHWMGGAFNYIETEIKTTTPEDGDKYDYLVLAELTDPYSVCDCRIVNKIWSSTGLVLYEVKENSI